MARSVLYLLTPRQQQIVQLLCRHGLKRMAVAYELGVTESTVKNHLTAVYRRLNMRSSPELCYRVGQEDGVDGYRPDIPAGRAEEV